VKLFRFLIIGAILTGLFFVYRHYSDKGFFKKEPEPKPVISPISTEDLHDETDFVLKSREELTRFTIKRKDLKVKFKKESGKWHVLSPIKGFANEDFIFILSKTLHETTIEEAFESNKEDLKRYRLDPAYYELEIWTTEQKNRRTLRIGSKNPAGTATYSSWVKPNQIYFLRGPIKPLLMTDLSKMRYPKLFSLPENKVTRIERKWNDKLMLIAKKENRWRVVKPEDHAVGLKHINSFINKFWNLNGVDSLEAVPFPEINGNNYMRFTFNDNSQRDLEIGALNVAKGFYPVLVPQENVKTWISKYELEPLLKMLPADLYSKRFMNIPLDRVARIELKLNDSKLFFIFKDNVWYQIQARGKRVPFEKMDLFLANLNDADYLYRLGKNEKSALLFSPSEARMEIFFFRKGERKSFMELKCYLREDYYYLEINNAPPLYVLKPESLNPFINEIAELIPKR